MSKLSAYMQLARLSNIPTVFSNVLVGVAVAGNLELFPFYATVITILVASLLYVGGMALNDLVDRHIDAEERPERPIPSGALSVLEVTLVTAACFLAPIAIIAMVAPKSLPFVVALAAAIVLYDLLHKKWFGSLLFMGLCRSFVYLLAASVTWNTTDAPSNVGGITLFAVIIAAYIVGLTIVAQKEVKGGLGYRRGLAIAMVFLPFVAFLLVPPRDFVWTVPAAFILAIWLARSAQFLRMDPPKIVPAVLGWLAGISLLDAFFLTLTPRPELALVALGCFAATVVGHRRIAGT